MFFILPTVFVAISVLQAAWSSALSAGNVGITGGNAISIEKAPFMASLFHNGEAVCAGTIVHERFILTAAFCLLGNSGDNWKVLVGSDNRDNTNTGVFIDVDHKYKFHPFEQFENVCLMRLKEPVKFGPKVAKLELFDNDLIISEGTMVNVTGWGRTLIDEDKSNELHQATVPIVGNEYCRSLRHTLICAGTSNQGACYGDIGAALTYNNIQIGVVSLVNPECAQPAIFARVSHYYHWIDSIINTKK